MATGRFVVYICFLQAIYIYRHFGTKAVTVSINQNITGLVGSNDVHLTCKIIKGKGEKIISVILIAKNKTEDLYDEKKTIAIFQPEKAGKLQLSGEYLSSRVTLTNITHTATNATMTFNRLERTDEKYYICKSYYYDKDGAVSKAKSDTTRILVKDEKLKKQLPESGSLEDSSAIYAVPAVILVLAVFIVIILIKRKNIESRWQNMIDCFNRRHGSDDYVDYEEKGDDKINDLNENELICISTFLCSNNEKGLDEINQKLPTSSDNMYAVPSETITGRIETDSGTNEDNRLSGFQIKM